MAEGQPVLGGHATALAPSLGASDIGSRWEPWNVPNGATERARLKEGSALRITRVG